MKRFVAAVALATALAVGAPVAGQAQYSDREASGDLDTYEDAFSNPLRLAYYLIYPVGFTAEWLVMRPLHYLISRPYLDRFFGYVPIGDEGTYQHMGERM